MTSDSEFSGSASDHDDSDTIVISSKSRILISPRKKGSKAVSKLLGSAAANEVVEQLLRGGTGVDADVVTKTKSSTVRVGNTEFTSHERRGQEKSSTGTTNAGATSTTHTATTRTSTKGNRATVERSRPSERSKPTKETKESHLANVGTSAEEEDEEADQSEASDNLSSDLSEPSNVSGDDDEYEQAHQSRQRQRLVHTRAKTATHHLRTATTRNGTSKSHTTRIQSTSRRYHDDEDESASDSVDAGEESDTSSMTKDSSHSHADHAAAAAAEGSRSSRERKFDDQLGRSSSSSHNKDPSAKAKKSVRHAESSSSSSRSTRCGNGAPRTNQLVSRRYAPSSDLDDSVILPTTATQEMEDLKQTLQNLAHQDPAISSSASSSHAKNASAFMLSSVPAKNKSASFASQLRREEYVAAPMANGHSEAAWAATAALSRFEKSTKLGSSYRMKSTGRRAEQRHSHGDDAHSSGSDNDSGGDDHSDGRGEPTVARRLFSTPPPRPAQHSSKMMTTTTTTPQSQSTNSFISKRATPSPHSVSFQSSPGSGYTSVLDTSLTGVASSSGAQGSRAVLSALKALQDKIRRLEEEREKLLQELSDIKVKTRKREAEFASSEKKFVYELGQTKESARAAYDAIRSEKEELKLELVKYDERRKAMEAELQHAHRLTSTFSSKADDLQSQAHASEAQRKAMQTELDATRAAQKQEVRDLKGELTCVQKDKDALQEQIKLLQGQLERESQNHTETRERLHETEQTVGGISQLNEKLVAKVWEANEIATKATKKSKKLLQGQRVSTLSRPTAASRAASISAANNNTNAAATPSRTGSTVKPTQRGSMTAKRASTSSSAIKKDSKRPSQVPASNNLELLRAANLGREIPFMLGTSANRSHSILSNVQEAIRQCDTSYGRPMTNPGAGLGPSLGLPPTPAYLKQPRKSIRKSSSGFIDHQEEPHVVRHVSATASILGVPSSHTGASGTLVGSRARESASASATRRPSAIRVPTPSTSYANPMQSQIMDDLDAAVQNAEAEFASLNRKYKDAVAKVERGQAGASQLSTQLGVMLDELEAKGKQLNLLKQVFEQASRSTINPIRHRVHSPEAVRRKTASLRILSDYRRMERDAKSPRSIEAAMQTTSPCGSQNTNGSRRPSFFSDQE